jgi:uncharacterized membrane protein YuzA (DUF378 family)
LLWADESMTAMGSERVVEYGYPKVHDGKNVLNDMYCSSPQVAVNKKDDAFIGGANWGQYYFGVIGYELAAHCPDMYTQTGVYRSTFAIIGLLGLFIILVCISRFIDDKFYRNLFIALFLLAELISISLALHLREVRYYSPALFFSSCIICLYAWYSFHKQFNKFAFSIALAVLLWIMFNMFSPLYFIYIVAITISETVISLFRYTRLKQLKDAITPSMPAMIAVVISCIAVFPLVIYFRTFGIKKVLDEFYHYNTALYWRHLMRELQYFRRLDLLWLTLAMHTVVLLNFKKIQKMQAKLFGLTNFLSLLFVISFFFSPHIDSPMFTRYIIYMQPVLSVIAIIDFICLLKIYSLTPEKMLNRRTALLTVIYILLFGFTACKNLPYIKGHLYEMIHPCKGPLDYTIPYIKANYAKPEDLIIATNYEESSYMYYLKSKVVVGFVGNNLAEDTLFKPDIISFRQSLPGFFPGYFNRFYKNTGYYEIFFPARDLQNNNVPELNFNDAINDHRFEEPSQGSELEKENLLIKKGLKTGY